MFAESIKAELDQVAAIKALAQSENRVITEAELSAVEKHLSAVDTLKAREAKAAELDARFASADAPQRKTMAAPRVEVGADLMACDPKKGFKSKEHYIAAVIEQGLGKKTAPGLRYLATVGSDEQSGTNSGYGGFLIPEGFRAELLMTTPEKNLFLDMVTKIPMQTPVVRIPARTDKNHSTSVAGGITATFTPETAEASLSRAAFEQVVLQANDLVVAVAVTENLLQDSPLSVAALFAQSMGQATQSVLLDKFLNGTGVGEPEGILTCPAKTESPEDTSQSGDTITATNLLRMRSQFWSSTGKGLWIASRTCMTGIGSIGANGVNVFQPAMAPGLSDMLLGFPIVWTEYLPEYTAASSVVLVDPTQYLFGSYGGQGYAEDASLRFLSRERILRLVTRVDGRCWWRSAITPKTGSTALSCIVTISDRS